MDSSVEAQFAKELAANQPEIRERALKKIGKWFQKISVSSKFLDENVFLRLWKGIFYYYWHCDKMLVQEDRADIIVKYIHNFKSIEYALLYLDTFFQTMAREYHGIDHYRLEKFFMLVRRMLQQGYQLLRNQKWELKYIAKFLKVLKKTVLHPSSTNTPVGLKMHMCDIYMEELAKAGSDELTSKLVRQFLVPYCHVLCFCEEPAFISSVKKEVFSYLLTQDPNPEEEDTLPVLKFNATAIQNMLLRFSQMPDVSRKNLKVIHSIIKEYEDYKKGITWADKMLPIQTPKEVLKRKDILKATRELVREEAEIRASNIAYRKKKRFTKHESENAEAIDL